MIVTPSNFDETLNTLSEFSVISCDTETTGLDVFKGDSLFSIILGTREKSFYLNFLSYPEGAPVLTQEHMKKLKSFFAQPKEWIFHNAKFDMGMLRNEGIELGGSVWDTMVAERVINSLLEQKFGDFSLAKTAARYGLKKDDTVEKWIVEHKAFTVVKPEGKLQSRKIPHYDQVPFSIIGPYGEIDQHITHLIRDEQLKAIRGMDENRHTGQPSVADVLRDEFKLIKVVYEMEQTGVPVDAHYCARAISHSQNILAEEQQNFVEQTGEEYKSSGKQNARIFLSEKSKWTYGKPTKVKKAVNPKFDGDTLAKFDHPAARTILNMKRAKSDSDFFYGFLHNSADNILRGTFHQHGARTGRFTSSNPNMQNMTKSAAVDAKFPVRRAIVPKEGHFFGMIDYDQMEYYLLLDYCNPASLIEKVKGGLDVHQATADVAGISRNAAKTVNFACIFGSGDQALSDSLGVSLVEGKRIKSSVLDASPEIREFMRQVKHNALHRKIIWNWKGRVYRFPDKNLVYKSVNTLIQGGCADIVKRAMLQCSEFLESYATEMVLNVHDELVFHGPMNEMSILPELQKIMVRAYPYRHIQLSAGIDVSTKSLLDKVPYAEFMEKYNGPLRENAELAKKVERQKRA